MILRARERNAKINTSKGKQNKKHKHKTEVEKMLNVGVIGCGGMGKDHIKRLTEKIQGAQVVAVSDVFEEGAKELLCVGNSFLKSFQKGWHGRNGTKSA